MRSLDANSREERLLLQHRLFDDHIIIFELHAIITHASQQEIAAYILIRRVYFCFAIPMRHLNKREMAWELAFELGELLPFGGLFGGWFER